MKKTIAAKRPGRPKKDIKKKKMSATVDPNILALAEKEAVKQGVSLSHVIERCLRCLLAKDCGESAE
jgi:predicted HicB family RNase H-like nuclease